MSVSSSATARKQYDGNGTTTAFTIDFSFLSSSELQVTLTDSGGSDTVLTETTHYTVTATNNDFRNGATLTMGTAPASGEQLTIIPKHTLTQPIDLVSGGAFNPETIEQGFDRNLLIHQQVNEREDRQPAYADTDDFSGSYSNLLPKLSVRAGKGAAWDSNGNWTAGTAETSGFTANARGKAHLEESNATVGADGGRAELKKVVNTTADYNISDVGVDVVQVNNTAAKKVMLPVPTATNTTYAHTGQYSGNVNAGREITVIKGTADAYDVTVKVSAAANAGTDDSDNHAFTDINGNTIKTLALVGQYESVTLLMIPNAANSGGRWVVTSHNTARIRGPETGTMHGKLTMQTSELTVVDNDILGEVAFQAPLDIDTGDNDSSKVAASIAARAEGTFSATSNATELVFTTGTTEDASASASGGDMTLSSAGLLTVADDIVLKSGGTIGGANDTDLLTTGNGALTVAGTLGATTGTFSGVLKTDDVTQATSTTDGSLQTDGGLSVAKDVVAGNDVKLKSDSAVLSFGDDNEVTLTHVHNTALTLSHNLAMADGKGIDFSADANASGMSSEILDDYEEGTWTPHWYDQPAHSDSQYHYLHTHTGAATWAIDGTQTGRYTKIGNVVHCSWRTTWQTAAAIVQFKLANLPFTAVNDEACQISATWTVSADGNNYSVEDYDEIPTHFRVNKNETTFQASTLDGSSAEYHSREDQVFLDNTMCIFGVSYFTDA